MHVYMFHRQILYKLKGGITEHNEQDVENPGNKVTTESRTF